MSTKGGKAEPLTEGPGKTPSFAPDGTEVYFIGTGERQDNIWAMSFGNQVERPLTELTGRRGSLGPLGLTNDGDYIYFTWRDDIGDIWVMDVVRE